MKLMEQHRPQRARYSISIVAKEQVIARVQTDHPEDWLGYFAERYPNSEVHIFDRKEHRQCEAANFNNPSGKRSNTET